MSANPPFGAAGSRLLRGMAAALLLAGAPTAASAAPRDAAGLGDYPGTYHRAMCPAGAYLVGLSLVVWYAMVEASVYCALPDANGVWTGQQFTATDGTIARNKPFPQGDLDELTANTHVAACPVNTYVTGLNMGQVTLPTSNHGTANLPWQMAAECKARGAPAVHEYGYGWTPFGDENDPSVMTGWDGIDGPRSCHADEVAVGVWAQTVSYQISQFGLICQRFAEIAPQTVKMIVGDGPKRPVGTGDPLVDSPRHIDPGGGPVIALSPLQLRRLTPPRRYTPSRDKTLIRGKGPLVE